MEWYRARFKRNISVPGEHVRSNHIFPAEIQRENTEKIFNYPFNMYIYIHLRYNTASQYTQHGLWKYKNKREEARFGPISLLLSSSSRGRPSFQPLVPPIMDLLQDIRTLEVHLPSRCPARSDPCQKVRSILRRAVDEDEETGLSDGRCRPYQRW